ncbi:hypothetical protein IGS68_35020 (plasmid) [Skermanella sp. TT6]|uniref:Chromosome partitioning protein ParB n=1 Tax=Skermanella cutis TaxID=2775420 RepID=A0ABX7BKC8_9PROT|nr:hypothetical protein [Skermanella sp. TT6]QQP93991.1 hypothetical protein IGS68_35020 [Skermanella sp. TT6]
MGVAPPPPSKRDKGLPPAATDTLGTLPGSGAPIRDTPLNFRVERTFRRDFKIAAAKLGISQVELLEKLFEKVDEVR